MQQGFGSAIRPVSLIRMSPDKLFSSGPSGKIEEKVKKNQNGLHVKIRTGFGGQIDSIIFEILNINGNVQTSSICLKTKNTKTENFKKHKNFIQEASLWLNNECPSDRFIQEASL